MEQRSPLPSWQEDWLYQLVFAELKRHCYRLTMFDEFGQSSDMAMYQGPVLRSWINNRNVVREITPQERKEFRLRMRGHSVYPFTVCSFHIFADRSRVVIGFRDGARAGRGSRMLVERVGKRPKLSFDPSGGAWIS
jgi:hypothetical protein